ncbi:hypothetical protein BDV95DRAFT_166900 [Massariosphaeria phaeospora]|uniref:Uncharacterized protein n=1 Tax=Massariosphaeria phaeospora TaxID=100035 RepID=A0A7C8MF94_9PLEO|nr:hypothetical protein BDV95DRAFT_166900 [Massariosphaeria phaeospora]
MSDLLKRVYRSSLPTSISRARRLTQLTTLPQPAAPRIAFVQASICSYSVHCCSTRSLPSAFVLTVTLSLVQNPACTAFPVTASFTVSVFTADVHFDATPFVPRTTRRTLKLASGETASVVALTLGGQALCVHPRFRKRPTQD